MTPESFVYWLQGFAELNPSMEQPTPEQWKSITEHLKAVFVKVTPEVKIQINPGPSAPSSKQLDEEIWKDIRREADRNRRLANPNYFGDFPVITC